MNQKEYEIIAGVFYKEFLGLGGKGTQYQLGQADEWRTLVILMASNLELHYPKTFDKAKFMKAAGL